MLRKWMRVVQSVILRDLPVECFVIKMLHLVHFGARFFGNAKFGFPSKIHMHLWVKKELVECLMACIIDNDKMRKLFGGAC